MSRCPPIEQLPAFLEGRLSLDEGAAIQGHLQNCIACETRLSDLRSPVPSMARQVDSVRELFESAWRDGRRPQIEDFLADVTEQGRASLLRELLCIEWQYRQVAGEEPNVEEYRHRFPEQEKVILEVAANSETIIRPAAENDSVPFSGILTATQDHLRQARGTKKRDKLPKLPGYELLGTLGQGGMGVVYKARDVQLKRLVAIKMIRAGANARTDELARFRVEAEAVARLQHPNIVQIHGIGDHDGLPFVVLEFVNGGSLDKRVNGTPLLTRDAARIVEVLARATQAAHDGNIIHRDLKPANVLLTAEGIPKISDFGLAKRLEDEAGRTQTGDVMGTPSYMSPEQAAGRTDELGPATDIYALGAILYDLLTGRPPFKATTPMETLRQVLDQEPVTPRQLNPAVDRDVETICLKSLSKSPARRYATASDLAEDLRRWLHGEPITARPVSRTERMMRWCRRNPMVSSLIATAAILLVAVAVVSTVSAVQLNDLANRERNEATRANNEMKRANNETETAKREKAKALDLAKDNAMLAEKEKTARVKADLSSDDALRQTKLAKRHLYNARMNLAQSAWEGGNVGQTVALLDLYRPAAGKETSPDDLRGFEWYYWDRLCHSELLSLKGHADEVNGVAFSLDGSRLASAAGDRTVKLWHATTGEEMLTLKGHTGIVTSVAFCPDDKRLASASYDKTVKVWNATSGQEMLTLKGHTDIVTSVAFCPDDKRLASASHDKTVKVWNATSGQEMLTLKGHAGWVRSVAFSLDGNRLASASSDQTVKVWDAASGQEMLTLKGHDHDVLSVAFSPDGKWLASASQDETVKVWDAMSGQEMLTLKGYTAGVVFSPDGKRLAAAAADRTVKIFDAMSGQLVLTLKGHTGRVNSVAFTADGKRLASASRDQTVKVWDATSGQETFTLDTQHNNALTSVSLSPDGKRLASASGDPTVKVWNATTRTELLKLKGHKGQVWCVAFNANGKHLASGGYDKTVKVWDVASGEILLDLNGHTSQVKSVAFSPDGKRLASASGVLRQTGEIIVWDAASGHELLTLKGHTAAVKCVAFSPDGKRLASGSEDLTVKVWDAASGQEMFTLKGHAGWIRSVAFSVDGKRLASASLDGTVKVWDSTSCQETLTLNGHVSEVWSVAFSPDGKRLASASSDRTVKVWDAMSGQETLTLKGHTGTVVSVAISPDGKRLMSGSQDHTVKMWGTLQHEADTAALKKD